MIFARDFKTLMFLIDEKKGAAINHTQFPTQGLLQKT